MTFTPAQVRRYSRHVLLPDVGGVGQARLLASAVAIAGGGAATRVAAQYLIAAGVGTLWLDGALAIALAGRNPDVTLRSGDPPADAARLAIVGDRDDLSLAEAFARGGEAAARLVHALATGGRR